MKRISVLILYIVAFWVAMQLGWIKGGIIDTYDNPLLGEIFSAVVLGFLTYVTTFLIISVCMMVTLSVPEAKADDSLSTLVISALLFFPFFFILMFSPLVSLVIVLIIIEEYMAAFEPGTIHYAEYFLLMVVPALLQALDVEDVRDQYFAKPKE